MKQKKRDSVNTRWIEGRAKEDLQLGGVQQTCRRSESVVWRQRSDFGEQGDLVSMLVFTLHRHVSSSNGLASKTSKVDGELLGVVLDNVNDGETLYRPSEKEG